jgi:hypothetical protein
MNVVILMKPSSIHTLQAFVLYLGATHLLLRLVRMHILKTTNLYKLAMPRLSATRTA